MRVLEPTAGLGRFRTLPYSGLIVRKRHVDTVFDLNRDEWLATFDVLERVKKHLVITTQPDGYSIGWNVGRIAGMDVAYAHLHVIPRFADEPKAGQVIRYHLKQADNRRPNPLSKGSDSFLDQGLRTRFETG